jgi:hypothetical protein
MVAGSKELQHVARSNSHIQWAVLPHRVYRIG